MLPALQVGNHLNSGTQRGSAEGFHLDALSKLGDIKSRHAGTSLLQFIVGNVLKARPSAQHLASSLAAVTSAANIQVTDSILYCV